MHCDRQHNTILLQKKLNILMYRFPFDVIIYRSYDTIKKVRFFWTTVYNFNSIVTC